MERNVSFSYEAAQNRASEDEALQVPPTMGETSRPSRPTTPASPELMARSSSAPFGGMSFTQPYQAKKPTSVFSTSQSYRAKRPISVFSTTQIDQMISDDKVNMDTYGVSELRDGFFDALFLKSVPLAPEDVEESARAALPKEFDKSHPLSPSAFLPRQWHELKSLAQRITTTRSGIKLLKSFLAFFIAYVLCLIPTVRDWLGPYDYIMVISVIINHPARTVGSQIDGAVFCIAGAASGLAWGVLGLLLSNATSAAGAGYGGILTMFLALFMASIAYIRSFFIRFYQSVLCSGMAICFTVLEESSGRSITWPKLRGYAIPWLLGQAIALFVNIVVFPDGGNRPLALALDKSFKTIQVCEL